MRKRISTIIFVIIFLIGLSILLYPAVSEYVNERHSSRAIASYDKLVEELPEADYSKELQDAQAYNEYLAQSANHSLAAVLPARNSRIILILCILHQNISNCLDVSVIVLKFEILRHGLTGRCEPG